MMMQTKWTYKCTYDGKELSREEGWLGLSRLPKTKGGATLRFCNWYCLHNYTNTFIETPISETPETLDENPIPTTIEEIGSQLADAQPQRMGFFCRIFSAAYQKK